jgi:Flp pilus assembly protein CpaB
MGRRTLLLVISILVAAVGVALVALYVKGADDRATAAAEARYHGPPPTPTATPSPAATRHDDINHLGITVEIDDADRAVGLIVPGDMVSIYTVRKNGTVLVDPVVESIRVISVGPLRTVNGADPDTAPPTIVGFDATRDQAHDIWVAQQKGSLTVAIRGANP